MSRIRSIATLAGMALAVSTPLAGQAAPSDFRAEWQGQFEGSAQKFVALAEAMPEADYGWNPMEGTMSVVEVYMHIARYNYMYLDENMGVAAPMAYADLEEAVTAKDEAVEILAASMDHVRSTVGEMSDAEFEAATTLYGRDVANWAVLFQLVAHMNEHLGQSIAYARSNGVVPPWSR
ncbi:MAG: DinB family protein [Gemmatimonadetes bacterium]|nr:DinB family protein [Gemmatimonadota bacterium]NNK63623.1 DinB family protein [Gemmatimonadota bacterium]